MKNLLGLAYEGLLYRISSVKRCLGRRWRWSRIAADGEGVFSVWVERRRPGSEWTNWRHRRRKLAGMRQRV